MFSKKFEEDLGPEERGDHEWHNHNPWVPAGGHALEMGPQVGSWLIPIVSMIGALMALSGIVTFLLSRVQ